MHYPRHNSEGDIVTDYTDAPETDSAFMFHGTWRDFAPIAFTNLLLTIVTLGIYRFWATTRERQYSWWSSIALFFACSFLSGNLSQNALN